MKTTLDKRTKQIINTQITRLLNKLQEELKLDIDGFNEMIEVNPESNFIGMRVAYKMVLRKIERLKETMRYG